jgi:hypothetical protein
MELPSDIIRIISEFSKPITHERWWRGSPTASALYNSELWDEYYYDITGELYYDRDNWTFYRWLEHHNHFHYKRISLY